MGPGERVEQLAEGMRKQDLSRAHLRYMPYTLEDTLMGTSKKHFEPPSGLWMMGSWFKWALSGHTCTPFETQWQSYEKGPGKPGDTGITMPQASIHYVFTEYIPCARQWETKEENTP